MQKVDALQECIICYTPFNSADHLPFILQCGHSICVYAIDKLFYNNIISCPICKKKIHYEDGKTQIGKNFALIKVIKAFEDFTFINVAENIFTNIETGIEEATAKIELENR